MICCSLHRKMAKGITLPQDPDMVVGVVAIPKASDVNAGLGASIAFKAIFKNLYHIRKLIQCI